MCPAEMELGKNSSMVRVAPFAKNHTATYLSVHTVHRHGLYLNF